MMRTLLFDAVLVLVLVLMVELVVELVVEGLLELDGRRRRSSELKGDARESLCGSGCRLFNGWRLSGWLRLRLRSQRRLELELDARELRQGEGLGECLGVCVCQGLCVAGDAQKSGRIHARVVARHSVRREQVACSAVCPEQS